MARKRNEPVAKRVARMARDYTTAAAARMQKFAVSAAKKGERARIVAWLRTRPWTNEIADAIERGEHDG